MNTTRKREPIVTDHCIERWIERVCCEQADVAPWDLETAFERAVPVGIPGEGRGRLHEPTGAVIVFDHDYAAGPPVLITVIHADENALNTDHLDPCPGCGRLYNAGIAPCSWCADGN